MAQSVASIDINLLSEDVGQLSDLIIVRFRGVRNLTLVVLDLSVDKTSNVHR